MKIINTIRKKVIVFWDHLWRDTFWSNITLAGMCILFAGMVWLVSAWIYDWKWNDTFVALLKAGNPYNDLPLGIHIILGLISTTLVSPFILATVTLIIRHRAEKVQLGQKRYKHIKDHYVMIGYNPYSASVILNLLAKRDNETSSLIILTVQPPKALRAELKTLLPAHIEKRVLIYAGSPLSEEHINNLNLSAAKAVYITLDGNEWDSAYSRTMAILPQIAKATQYRSESTYLPVNLLINDSRAYEIAQTLTIPSGFEQFQGTKVLNYHICNFYENWARLLWSYNGLKDSDGTYHYDSLDFEPLENTDKYVHLVVVGFNSMGKALVNEAIRVCHYPNFNEEKGVGKTRITIIDPLADKLSQQFKASYPQLSKQVTDIEIIFKKAEIEDEHIREELTTWATDEKQLLTIAICLSDPDMAMQMALTLPEEVYFTYDKLTLQPINNNKSKVVVNHNRPRILVRQSVRNGIQELITAHNQHFTNLKIFGTYYEGLDIDFLNDDLAIFINGLYDEHFYEDIERIDRIEELNVQEKYPIWRKIWYNTSIEDKQKTRHQIDMYRSIFAFMNRQEVRMGSVVRNKSMIKLLAEVEHRRWAADVSLMVYRQKQDGEVRVDDVKIHNCIDDYDYLTLNDQLKDHVIIISSPVLSAWGEKIHGIIE